MSKTARGTFTFDSEISVIAYASSGGSKESEGPLGEEFDLIFKDNLLGESSWEKAESRIQYETAEQCIKKSGLTAEDFDAIFTGDLLNQCIASTFGIRGLGIPHVGLYGACSTMALAMLNASTALESGSAERCIAVTSSHFSSAERQYRNPLQYGGQRTPTAQWTVTGAGSVALGSGGAIRVVSATIGVMQDYGIKDVNNMGAAMAPVDVILTP